MLSLILHGLIAFGLARVETDVRTRASRLMVEVKTPRSRLPAPTSAVARDAPQVAPRRLERPPAPKLAVPAAVTARPSEEAPAIPSAASAVLAPSAGTQAPPPPATAAATAGYDGEDLRRFKLAIAVQARRFQRYPGLARERGWQGTAEVAIRLSPDVGLSQVAIEKSSGFAVLDEQAVDMIRRASTATPIPAGLQGRGIHFVLPVQFRLED